MPFVNPHDRFIRKMLSVLEDAKALFKATFSKEVYSLLKMNAIDYAKDSLLDENLKEYFSDILFSVPLKTGGNIASYILFEHKSFKDNKIYSQLLIYLGQLYQNHFENYGKYEVIIPYVFYHEKKAWDLCPSFGGEFKLAEENEYLRKFIPDFSIEMVQLNSGEGELLTESSILNLQLRILQNIRLSKSKFMRYFEQSLLELSRVSNPSKRVAVLKTILEYILSARKDAREFKDKKFFEKIEEDYMNALEELQLEGMLKGKLEGKLEDARLMKAEGIDISVILRVTGLSEAQLKENGILKL
jgi:predicted transposase/invertase (TIGR01784 family)